MFYPQNQFNAAVMRNCQGSSRLHVAELESRPMFDDLYRELEELHNLLKSNNHDEYIRQSTVLIKNIESTEHAFFTTKYQSNFPGLTKSVIDSMACNAASISDDQGQFHLMRLKSRVDYWIAHPRNFGETSPELEAHYIKSLLY